jgi:exosortase/archaeosortase family protein
MILSDKWNRVPRPVRQFLLKAIALFAIWKAVYLLILLPGRVLDKPLTYVIGEGTVAALNVLPGSHDYNTIPTRAYAPSGNWEDVMAIRQGQNTLLSIADVCNGLELLVLYAGLIICLPAAVARKLKFILGGILLIEIINVIRCAGLVLIYLHRPQYLDFTHHFLFTFVVYAFIFLLWFLFSRDPGFAKKLQVNATTR